MTSIRTAITANDLRRDDEYFAYKYDLERIEREKKELEAKYYSNRLN